MWQTILAIIGTVGGVGACIAVGRLVQKVEHLDHVHEHCDIKEVSTMVRAIWKGITVSMVNTVREHLAVERDILLDKFIAEIITDEELQKLFTLLKNQIIEGASSKCPQLQMPCSAKQFSCQALYELVKFKLEQRRSANVPR